MDADPPSAELVARVRNLYHNQVPDVRILIPVLNGLTKKEVLDALPKLFQHKPETVKKALSCLWGIQVIEKNCLMSFFFKFHCYNCSLKAAEYLMIMIFDINLSWNI